MPPSLNLAKLPKDELRQLILAVKPKVALWDLGKLNPEEVIELGKSLSELERNALALIPPKTKDALWNYVYLFWGLKLQRKSICLGCSAPFDAFAAAYFREAPVVVWWGNRGSGKSVAISALGLTILMTTQSDVLIIGGSSIQAKRILQYTRASFSQSGNIFWASPFAPTLLRDPGAETRERAPALMGGAIEALASSENAVRGRHVPTVLIDEVDCMDEKLYESATGIPQTDLVKDIPPITVVSSTWQHPDKCMAKVVKNQRNNDLPVFGFCYKELLRSNGGFIPDSDIEAAKLRADEYTFRMEYENKEPQGDGLIFDDSHLDFLFDKELGFYKGETGFEYVFEEPIPGEKYYHGADWAKARDYTVITTWRKCGDDPDKLVSWVRVNNEPWPHLVKRFDNRIAKYGGQSAHDATGGGSVVHDMLTHKSEPVNFSSRKLVHEILSDYIAAVQRGELRGPYIENAYYEHRYLNYAQVYGQDHLPDTVAAAALAYYARRLIRNDVFLISRLGKEESRRNSTNLVKPIDIQKNVGYTEFVRSPLGTYHLKKKTLWVLSRPQNLSTFPSSEV